jgi:uncharacterized membrane protein YbhN (UPF0104 family)
VAAIDIAIEPAAPRIRARAWLPLAVGAAIIAVLLLRFGPGPFVEAFRRLDGWALLAAITAAAGSTVCAAYRWRVVAAGLGVPVGLGRAVRAYYGSQFLNATLPGGVLGDVHRGLRQGSHGQPLGRSLRAVAWERTLGQAVQVLLTLTVLVAVPSPLRPPPVVAIALAVAAGLLAVAVLLFARRRRNRPDLLTRAARTVAADWRGIRSQPKALRRIAIASAGAVGGHVALLLLAARSVAPHLAVGAALPLALAVLLIGALPVNVAGWGPREGAAAWAFGSAGLGAAQGLSISVLYGVLALIGTLPGAVLLVRRQRAGRHA